MNTRHFSATITDSGNRAVIELPFDPDEVWPPGTRHVAAFLGHHRFRGVLAPTALGFVLPLGPAFRRDTGLDVGDTVDVVLDAEEPLVESQADDIRAALEGDRDAIALFRSMAPFYRKNFLRWIDQAKRAETRAARVAEMVIALAAGRIEK